MFIGREKELALLQEDYIGKAIIAPSWKDYSHSKCT